MKRAVFVVASTVLAVLSALSFTRSTEPVAPVAAPQPFDQTFWRAWGDGKGELAGYDLIFPRYGELRRGTAVTIFVTEPFSNSARVKADPGKHPKQDEFQVMKLNLVRDFPTGIYDYNLMTSTFVALQPTEGLLPGQTAKVSFSSQDWCGQVYQQLLFRGSKIEKTLHSYFDGEADQHRSVEFRQGGVSEDALFHWARGLASPFLEPGVKTTVPIFQSLTSSRLKHVPADWHEATFTRSATPESITVPAGTFQSEVRRVTIAGGPTWTFWVEQEAPHRILRWKSSDGEEANLIRSDRLSYWKMNGSQFEEAVTKFGLTPRAPRMP